MFFLFIGLSLLYILATGRKKDKAWTQLIKYLLLGALFTSLATLSFKLFLAPPNRDIFINPANRTLPYLNWNGFLILKNSLMSEIFDIKWGFVWPLFLVMFILRIPKFFHAENMIISLFFILYFCILVYIYITTQNFSLSWRLENTLSRIYFTLFPSIVFFCFYAFFHERNSA